MKFILSILVAISFSCSSSAQNDTLRVYFNTDDPFLNRKALEELTRSFLEVSNSNHILIIGYADYRGDTYYNDMLSMRRAQSVAEYFKSKGLDANNIRLVYGRGEVKRSAERPEGYATDRRVDVILLDKGSFTTPSGRIYSPVSGQESSGKEKTLDDIKTMKVGEALVLNDINFFLNSSRITPQSGPTLEKLYHTMKDNPGLSIQIEGHICCSDDSTEVIKRQAHQLSLSRAEAVFEFLVNKGIVSTRMRFAGFGRTRPKVAIERTEADRLQNRRVEARILTQ